MRQKFPVEHILLLRDNFRKFECFLIDLRQRLLRDQNLVDIQVLLLSCAVVGDRVLCGCVCVCLCVCVCVCVYRSKHCGMTPTTSDGKTSRPTACTSSTDPRPVSSGSSAHAHTHSHARQQQRPTIQLHTHTHTHKQVQQHSYTHTPTQVPTTQLHTYTHTHTHTKSANYTATHIFIILFMST